MDRSAVTLALPAPVAEVTPRALRKSALPVTLRSAPVELFSVTTPARDGRWRLDRTDGRAAGRDRGSTRADRRGLDAAGEVDRAEDVVDGRLGRRRGSLIDDRVAVAVGGNASAGVEAPAGRLRRRSGAGAEGDGLAVHGDGVTVRGRRAERGGCRGAEQRVRAGERSAAVGGVHRAHRPACRRSNRARRRARRLPSPA